EMKLGPYDITEDGSSITYAKDITKKTDYDVIGGAENEIHLVPAGGGQARLIIKSTKGLTILWSRDGPHYAYAKDGNIFFASIDDNDARNLTGKKAESEKEKAASPDAKTDPPNEVDKDRKDKEKFSVVRLSPNGSSLVASNKEGL